MHNISVGSTTQLKLRHSTAWYRVVLSGCLISSHSSHFCLAAPGCESDQHDWWHGTLWSLVPGPWSRPLPGPDTATLPTTLIHLCICYNPIYWSWWQVHMMVMLIMIEYNDQTKFPVFTDSRLNDVWPKSVEVCWLWCGMGIQISLFILTARSKHTFQHIYV